MLFGSDIENLLKPRKCLLKMTKADVRNARVVTVDPVAGILLARLAESRLLLSLSPVLLASFQQRPGLEPKKKAECFVSV